MEMTQENWKKNLKKFLKKVSSPTYHTERGGYKKNLLSYGIYSRYEEMVPDKIGKMVIYADISASAYEFCSTMISEVSQMAKGCRIMKCDINLFADNVYAEHKNLHINNVSSNISVNESVPPTEKERF